MQFSYEFTRSGVTWSCTREYLSSRNWAERLRWERAALSHGYAMSKTFGRRILVSLIRFCDSVAGTGQRIRNRSISVTVRRFLTLRLGCSSHTCRFRNPTSSISRKRAGSQQKRLTLSWCRQLHGVLETPFDVIRCTIEIVFAHFLGGVCKPLLLGKHLGNPQSELNLCLDACDTDIPSIFFFVRLRIRHFTGENSRRFVSRQRGPNSIVYSTTIHPSSLHISFFAYRRSFFFSSSISFFLPSEM